MAAQVFLTIDSRSKSIPYPAASNADSQNFGFKPLKGKLDKVDRVRELSEIPGVADLLRAINASETAFFSVGCEKFIGPNTDGTYYVRGYVEFAFNHPEFLRDVQYMALFATFNRYIVDKPMTEEWSVNWHLEPAFFQKVDTSGYSCCMWLHVRSYFTRERAVAEYNSLARHLIDFFEGFPADPERPKIY